MMKFIDGNKIRFLTHTVDDGLVYEVFDDLSVEA